MKFFKALFLYLLTIFLISTVIFYFWAGSTQKEESEYYNLIEYDVPADVQDTITVMTYNIGYLSGMMNNRAVDFPLTMFEMNLIKLREFLGEESPDILGLQEIDFASNRSWYQNQMDSISEGYHQGYSSVNWDRTYVPFPYWPPRYHFGEMLSGQAILSKYPLGNEETIVLEKPISAPFYYNHFYLDRLIQIVDIRIGETTVKLMNLHLEAFDLETRELQAHIVADLFEQFSSEMPVLLIGDFNGAPNWAQQEDETMRTILSLDNIASAITEEDYSEAPEAHFTFNTENPYQMIDFILYNPSHIQKIEAKVHSEAGKLSDHFPVSMTYTFTSKNDSTILE